MVQYGKIRLDIILWFEISLLILLPFYTYYMAVYKQGMKPFPHPTVTDTACPYPQNIAFRFGNMTAASFLALIFFCTARWMKYIQVKTNYPRHIPNAIYFISEIVLLPYCITIGTIDSGKTGHIHDICAVIFFVVLFALTIL